jgi:hypothetical protein
MAFSWTLGDVAEVRFIYTQNSQKLLNVFHYRVSIAGTADNGVVESKDFLNWLTSDPTNWPTYWQAKANNQCTMYQIDIQKIYPSRLPYINKSVSITGSSLAAPFPQNVQLSVTKIGSVANRHGVGHTEVPAIDQNVSNNGSITEAGATWLTNLGDWLTRSLNTGVAADPTFTPILLTRSNPSLSQTIQTFRIQATSRVARRRTVRVGE